MIHGWLAKAGPYVVEHVPCPHPGLVDETAPAKGVLHTTEGSLAGALAKFKSIDAPTFLVGEHRILQLIPLGSMAAALVHSGAPQTNGVARVQIEMATFSKHDPYLPPLDVLDPTAALMYELDRLKVVPLKHFANPNRNAAKWSKATGWCGHQDVPENAHWDPGALNWDALFTHAVHLGEHRAASTQPKPKSTRKAGKKSQRANYDARHTHSALRARFV